MQYLRSCKRATSLLSPLKWPAAVAAITLLLQSGYGHAQTVGPNVNLTKASGNQYETAVAINPSNNRQIFVVARNEVGGLYTARSSDGGASWTIRLIGRLSTPAAGDVSRGYGNPSVAWDEFDNLFLAYLCQGGPVAPTFVCLAVSNDGGSTFKSPIGSGAVVALPVNPPAGPVFGDQPTVAVGPGSAGFPGSVWVTYWTNGGIMASGAGVSGRGAIGAFTSLQPEQPSAVNFGDIAVGPAGEVMVTYGPNSGTSGKIYVNVKPDGLGPGSFSTFTTVVPVNVGGFTSIPAQPNWGIDPEAGLAWDRSPGPHRGRVYLVYTDAPSVGSANTNIFVTYSDDKGTTWSTPVQVNDDAGVQSHFLPRISLDQSNGMIAVTWYDARYSSLNNTTRYFGAFSVDGGKTFSASLPIAAGTSDQANSPAALNVKKTDYGDYTGNAFAGGILVPAWADNSNSTGDNPDGATSFDVYTAIVQAPVPVRQPPSISDGGVTELEGFGANAGLAAGAWIEIHGSNLADRTLAWGSPDFVGGHAPAQLDNVQVTVNGKTAAISFIDPSRVTALVPDDIGLGPAAVIVTNHGLSSSPAILQASPVLPGLLISPGFNIGGKQYVVAMTADGTTFAGFPQGLPGARPAKPGEVITTYGIGFGPVTPPVPAGTICTGTNILQNPLSVLFDQTPVDLSAPYTYTGLAPGWVGLYQFSFTVPDVPDGDHRLEVTLSNAPLPQTLFIATKR